MAGGSGDLAAVVAAAVVLVLMGAVLVALGRLGRSGRLKRNAFAGVRTRATMSSDEAWDAAQRASAGYTIVAGWGAAVGGVALAVVVLLGGGPDALPRAVLATTLVTAAWAAGWAIAGGVAGQRAAREITRTS